MTDEDLLAHARKLRTDLCVELPDGVGNTIDALCDALEASNDLVGEMETIRRIASGEARDDRGYAGKVQAIELICDKTLSRMRDARKGGGDA